MVSQIIGTLVGTPTLSNALADLVSVVTVKSPHSADDLTGVLKGLFPSISFPSCYWGTSGISLYSALKDRTSSAGGRQEDQQEYGIHKYSQNTRGSHKPSVWLQGLRLILPSPGIAPGKGLKAQWQVKTLPQKRILRAQLAVSNTKDHLKLSITLQWGGGSEEGWSSILTVSSEWKHFRGRNSKDNWRQDAKYVKIYGFYSQCHI